MSDEGGEPRGRERVPLADGERPAALARRVAGRRLA
jgi:hypothetical protein